MVTRAARRSFRCLGLEGYHSLPLCARAASKDKVCWLQGMVGFQATISALWSSTEPCPCHPSGVREPSDLSSSREPYSPQPAEGGERLLKAGEGEVAVGVAGQSVPTLAVETIEQAFKLGHRIEPSLT